MLTALGDGVDPGALAQPWIDQGLPGAAVVALALLVLVMLRREWKRAEKAEAALEALQVWVREQIVPVLVRTTDGSARMSELTEQNIEALTKATEAIKDRRRT